MSRKFNHLNVPDQWNHYWSRFPQGYTILESLLDWVGQVDLMVDQTNLNTEQATELNEMILTIETNLRKHIDDNLNILYTATIPAALETLFTEWNTTGKLAGIINDEVYQAMNQTLLDALAVKKYEKNATVPLVIPTYEGSYQTVHPSVVFDSSLWNGYEYWMAHTPYPETNDDFENPSISASRDGINWVKAPGLTNPIDQPTTQELVAGYHMSDTELVRVGNTLECWYRFNKNGGTEQIMRKKSTDGVTWSAREITLDLTGSGNYALSPSLVYDGGYYKLWFVGSGNQIHFTQSPTGTAASWTTPVIVPVAFREGEATRANWHLDVMKEGSGYKAVINTARDAGTLKRRLVLATSLDGLSFTDAHTILETPDTGWDALELYRATILKVPNGIYRMYYSASSKGGQWRIGLLQGSSLDTLNNAGMVYNAKGRLVLPGVAFGEIGHLTDEELLFGKKGEKSVKWKNTANNEMTLLTEVGANQATLIAFIMKLTRAYISQIYGEVTFYGPNGDGVPFIKLLNPGVADVGLAIGSTASSLKAARTSDKAPGHFEGTGTFYAPTGVVVPSAEGWVKYNYTTHKLQVHNGTTWTDLH